MLRLRHLAPSGLLCFVFLEGAVVLGLLLALAELVSWWGVLVLPVTVALMVKFNDLIAGALTQQQVAPETTTARAAVLRPAAMPMPTTPDPEPSAELFPGSAPTVEQRMTGPGFGFATAGSARAGSVFGFPGAQQDDHETAGSRQTIFSSNDGSELYGGEPAFRGAERSFGAGEPGHTFGSPAAGQAFGYAGVNAGDAYGDSGYAPAQSGYGPAWAAPVANYAHAAEEQAGRFPAAGGGPGRRQWAEQLDVQQQMARQAAVRRYE
ncbi:hypothetical protein ACTI_32470 [Actinoplanes sp. OR16]|nr:hypothetical protein ACTI_32470 [Actinoplanes sp. OR16]